ncbi:hypothetical protein FSP39_019348 [Pinctada imbricata]|uniref:Cyclic GMP-AMP synthase n=1 Tax=Pinctada imbricata TaxID=66713 RepID=A0AA88Y865_PINIB|nr:hypothetical protein FSP39_019348 [Pinctada imbricata]
MGETFIKQMKNHILHKCLTVKIGCQETISLRQQMFIIQDIVNGFGDVDSFSISSGSLAEGLNFKTSDEDIMLVLKHVDIIQETKKIDSTDKSSHVRMEPFHSRPGFARLFLISENCNNDYLLKAIDNRLPSSRMLSSRLFRRVFLVPGQEEHGPCVSDGIFDFAVCLYCPSWPSSANAFFERRRPNSWPSKVMLHTIQEDGCFLVPVGPRNCEQYDILWRISFSVSERRLVLSFNHTQMLVYGLLKIMLKNYIQKWERLADLLCSYFLKTALFFAIESTAHLKWTPSNILLCVKTTVGKIMEWVAHCYCPNYFIPENNMFIGKINIKNNRDLLDILRLIRDRTFQTLIQLVPLDVTLSVSFLNEAQRQQLEEADLDLLCYRVSHIYPFDSRHIASLAALRLEELISKETNPFLRGVLMKFRTSTHHELAQMIRPSGTNKTSYKETRTQKCHLRIAGRVDMTSSNLLLASFYYCQGQYTKTRDLILKLLSKQTTNVINLRSHDISDTDFEAYKENLCGRGYDFRRKMVISTMNCVIMLDDSSLCPPEFAEEVQFYRPLFIFPPLVFAYTLLFLSCKKLNNRKQAIEALKKLKLVVDNEDHIHFQQTSNASTILGVCYEIQGDLNNAVLYYSSATQKSYTCKSAQKRLDRLRRQHCLS